MAKRKILIVDDEASIRFALRDFLEAHRFEVCEAADGRQAETVFRVARPDAVIADYRLPDMNALALLPRLKDIDASVPLVADRTRLHRSCRAGHQGRCRAIPDQACRTSGTARRARTSA